MGVVWSCGTSPTPCTNPADSVPSMGIPSVSSCHLQHRHIQCLYCMPSRYRQPVLMGGSSSEVRERSPISPNTADFSAMALCTAASWDGMLVQHTPHSLPPTHCNRLLVHMLVPVGVQRVESLVFRPQNEGAECFPAFVNSLILTAHSLGLFSVHPLLPCRMDRPGLWGVWRCGLVRLLPAQRVGGKQILWRIAQAIRAAYSQTDNNRGAPIVA